MRSGELPGAREETDPYEEPAGRSYSGLTASGPGRTRARSLRVRKVIE